MDHSKEFPYRRVSFPVVCVNGFIADAATGKRLFYDSEAGAYMPMGQKKVWKNTAQTYFTEVFQLQGGLLTYQVLRADVINKHGLVWEVIFSGALKPKVRDPVYEQGVGTMVGWLKSEQARALITPGLLLPVRYVIMISVEQCI